MAVFRHACPAEGPLTLQNQWMRLELYRRKGGWGWGELFAQGNLPVAILEHLGEIKAADLDIPMRLEAPQWQRRETPDGDTVVFPVASAVIPSALEHTSFVQWMNYPLRQPVLEGTVALTLRKDRPVLEIRYELRCNVNLTLRYFRGPWLKVGEGSFGADKDDAILPGVDWVCGREWSSGMEGFKEPWARRFIPHRHKVSVPVMAVSHDGTAISLAWQADRVVSRWFNNRDYFSQPVFASPDFIERADNHLLGIMLPDAVDETDENQPEAVPGMELHLGQEICLEAEIAVSRGNSVQAIVDWVARHGLPKVEIDWRGTLDRIAGAYNRNLWFEGRGFGCRQDESQISAEVPDFLTRYVKKNAGTQLAGELTRKIEWCRSRSAAQASHSVTAAHADDLLRLQRPDGSFVFDPDGRHYAKDDFVVTRDFAEPMGLAGDTALDLCMLPAMELMDAFDLYHKPEYRLAARRAVDFCMPMQRPEGGDYWETPLHSPSLLAAGHAAIANLLAYREFSQEAYREKAVYWIRCLLPFTHLWEPAHMPMCYDTKPCFCSSDWYFANWVRDHVQWEVLRVCILSARHRIRWSEYDPEIDWDTYHAGVTAAAARWMIDHHDDNWRPHNMPWTLQLYRKGLLDGCYPDTHNCLTGHYGGMAILPQDIAENIQSVMDERNEPQ